MITPWTIYWITRLDTLGTLATIIIVLASIATGAGGLYWLIEREDVRVDELPEFDRRTRKFITRAGSVAVAAGLCGAFIPSTKEAAAMLVIPAVANNADVQALGSELPKLAREWVESLRPKQAEKESK